MAGRGELTDKAWAVIEPLLPPVLDAISVRGPGGGRPRKRPGLLKQGRDLATRYAKRAVIYRASLVLISAIIWLQ